MIERAASAALFVCKSNLTDKKDDCIIVKLRKEMIMEKQKVFIPCYGRCGFGSLKEAVNYVKRLPGGLSVYIEDIVMYNIRFRDCLRKRGINGLIFKMICEAPEIAFEKKAMDDLKHKWTDRMGEHIADYDIQCLPKDGAILIEGYSFNGLDEICNQVELVGFPSHDYTDKWSSRENLIPNPAGLHIGRLLKGYPTFDSYDASDSRCYNNYVFSKQPLTGLKMDQYCEQVSANFNFCMVHEYIPEELLPVLYWDGDDDYVLLATAKVV